MTNNQIPEGTRVKLDLTNTRWSLCLTNPADCEGVVHLQDGWTYVTWDNDTQNAYKPYDFDLIPVTEEKLNEDQ